MKLSTRRQGFTLVEIMIVVVIIGLLAAMAIPAFQKVRATSREKTIENNIRQIGSGADQYFLEFGTSTVNVSNLIGPTNYIKNPIVPVAGETYPTAVTTGTSFSMTWNGGSGTVSKSWSF
jgi:type IV pilus assembly protein PilA